MPDYSPQQIDTIESFRASPYCSMSGCNETETVIAAVVQWLAANGNEWGVELPPLETLATEKNLSHSHWYDDDDGNQTGYPCNFKNDLTENGKVNAKFIRIVHRGTDGMRLNDAALHTLRPDLFPEPINAL